MRVLMLEQAALPGQMLAPGVVVDVDEATAAWLVEAGAAQAVEQAPAAGPAPAAAQQAQPVESPARTRRKAG